MITSTVSGELQSYMQKNVGAFPRDPQDIRLLNPLETNTIATQSINGVDFFNDAYKLGFTTMPAAPVDSDGDGMPDTWEATNGLNSNLSDHNGTQLSKKFTGVDGYTNLECYLNELSDKLVGQRSVIITPPDGNIITGILSDQQDDIVIEIGPNPSEFDFTVKVNEGISKWNLEMFDLKGRSILKVEKITLPNHRVQLPKLLANGTYVVKIQSDSVVWQRKLMVIK